LISAVKINKANDLAYIDSDQARTADLFLIIIISTRANASRRTITSVTCQPIPGRIMNNKQ